MSYPSFRTYLRTLQELVKRKSSALADESIILSNLCLTYGRQIGLPERDMKTLFLAAHFKNLGAITVSSQAFDTSFDHDGKLMACVADWFEESAKFAQLAGLHDVEMILSQYYHRAIPADPLAKIFQVLNAWVACHQRRGWRRAMSDREALIVLKQRAIFAWSDPRVVTHFVEHLPQSTKTVQDHLHIQPFPSHQSFSNLAPVNRPLPVKA